MTKWLQKRRFGSTNADLVEFWTGLGPFLRAQEATDAAYLDGLL